MTSTNETLTRAVKSVTDNISELKCSYYTGWGERGVSPEVRRNELRAEIAHWQGKAREALESAIAFNEE